MSWVTGLSRSRLCLIGIGLALVAAATMPAEAQLLYGGLVGNVVDAQGAVVPGASVTIVNTDTNLKREMTTDAQGGYSFTNIQAGPYDVRVVLTGFKEIVRTRVPVTVGQISRVDLTLAVGAVSEVVTVQSAAELLQTDKADTHTELNTREITNLPLNQFRNYQALQVLVPGSMPATLPNAETDTPERSLNVSMNGQEGAANTTLTDGTRNVNVGLPHHNIYIPPAETIETVNITTGSMDAEEGMAAGVAITVITKSGTNNFKGSAFEFFNNEKLNAKPYYFGRGAIPAKLPIERQTFGGTLGGPIRRNQLFFFGSYEGYISRRNQFVFFNVPTAAMRNGDFSGAVNANGAQQRIYDPLSGDLATGTGRVQFENNQIPAGRVNAITRQLQALYPMPNIEGTGLGGLTNNYRTTRQDTTDRHNFDAKMNWNRTATHQLWGKYSHMNALVDDLFTFPIGSADGDGGETKVHLITGGQTWSFGKSLLLDSAFGISMFDQFCSSPDFGLGMMGLDLGIPGTNDQGRNDFRYAGMPDFRTGFTALGNTPTWSPTYRDEGTVSFSTNVTKIAGSHDFRMGYRLDYLHLDNWQPERANPRGRFDFAGNSTRTFGTGAQTSNIYNTYAAFMLGLVGTAQQELPVRAVHRARVAARDVLPRSVDGEAEADAGPRPAVGVLPDHVTRRSADRDAGSADTRCPHRRRRGQSEEHGPGGSEGLVRPAGRRGLSSERADGVTRRLRVHARRPRNVGTGSVPRRLQLPARAERELPASGRDVHVRVVRNDQSGHSAPRGAGSEQRPYPAAELLRHADRRAGVDGSRPNALVERRVRAAPAAERVG